MKLLPVLFTLISFYSLAQNVQIDTLVLSTKQQFDNEVSNNIQFPVVRTGDEDIDALINEGLKNEFTNHEYPDAPLDSTLIKWADGNYTTVDFTVNYNHQGILSLQIQAEVCIAYCSTWQNYYNYSTITGQVLGLSAIVDTTGNFRALVYQDIAAQYQQQRQELEEMLNEPEAGLDQSTYEWALKNYEACEKAFKLENYILHTDRLEIISDCYMPNAIKNLTPIINLEYSFSAIEDYLKIKK